MHDLIVTGVIHDNVKDNTIYYIAAAGPDRRASYTGSGLPFANKAQAFEKTSNVGKVILDINNRYNIKLITPNSYLVGLGSVTVPPTLFIHYYDSKNVRKNISLKVSESIPYRCSLIL